MLWVWIVLAIVLFVAMSGAVSAVHSWRKRQNQYAQAMRLWQETPSGRRAAAMSALPLDAEPNGPAWYLTGCAHLHNGDTRQAARAFGMAHHADCNLESAALLTFACLKATEGEDSDIVEQIITTWHEMSQPDILRQKQDRLMLACLGSTADETPDLPPLGRLAWLVVAPHLRPKVQQTFRPPVTSRRRANS
ncbi:MAG: hypothetical protein JXQ75_10410 [Phycisphaerae bacterium]|nr:hypothetical protein [Phycisphaerae bacterium]